MSLQVWLPLNGNLDNQGIGDNISISGTASYSSNGKIASKYLNTNNRISVYVPSIKSTKICTFSFWAYVVSASVTSDWILVARIDDQGINSGSNMRFEVCPSSRYNGIYCFSNHNNASYGLTTGCITSPVGGYYDQWVHFCFTSDGTTFTRYMNGVKIGSCPWTGEATFSGNFLLANNHLCYKQDVRIYDHCLSAKEVKEISKGLVCHFPLKSQYETGQVNKYSGDVAEGSLSYNQFTKTKLEDERGYNYKLSYTGTGGNSWKSMNAGYFSFTVGKKYHYSCKVRCHSTNFSLYLRASRSSNDWVTDMTNVLNPDGEWHEYVVSQTINSTYDRAGSTVTCNPILEFYSDNLSTSGKVYSADFDIKDVQVIESDCYVPFIDNSISSNIISDCSGYGNDGVRNGTINWSNNSPRYNGSYIPTTNSSYISTILNTSGYANSYTFSYWAKINNMDNKMAFGFSDGNRLNLYPTNSIFCWNTGDSANNPFQNNGTNVTFTSYNGAWHHYAITGNGTTTTLYIDGEKKGTARTYRAITGTKLFLSGWDTGTSYKWTGGNISDFRLYSTCFSESDVKSIYNVSASIDRTGVLFCGEVMEN